MRLKNCKLEKGAPEVMEGAPLRLGKGTRLGKGSRLGEGITLRLGKGIPPEGREEDPP